MYRRCRFDADIIELCVRWYITYRLSYRNLVAMMAERGISMSHTTIHRTRVVLRLRDLNRADFTLNWLKDPIPGRR